ncbi:hypothetical protein KIN20_024170 [Parelaphostrongylus tenuis]|uniref:Uncharacterized protein n=1 Tax=Parelaphostrongylus tenuis TaxID=148309 RepID=A0AAD5QW57_PARTN|nr:hypothetical protein KIN20_024170 [Parelaphostrongylus tenuis]
MSFSPATPWLHPCAETRSSQIDPNTAVPPSCSASPGSSAVQNMLSQSSNAGF